MLWSNDSGSHPKKSESKKHWCGRTSRALSFERCLRAEAEDNEEWSCGNVQQACKDAGWTKKGQIDKESDENISKLTADTTKDALAPTDATAGGAMGAEAPQSGSNTMLYVGAGVGLLVVVGLAFFLLKPSGAPAGGSSAK